MTASISQRRADPYIFGKLLDTLFLTGSASLLLMLLLPELVKVIAFPAWIAGVLCNQPHYSATYERVYSDWRETKTYFPSAIVAPIILLALAVVAAKTSMVSWFFMAYLVGAGFHYSGQTYGLAIICAGRFGLKLEPREKQIIRAAVWAPYIFFVACGGVYLSAAFTRAEVPVVNVNWPGWLPVVAAIGVASTTLAYVWLNARIRERTGRFPPAQMNIMVITHGTWFTASIINPSFWAFIPFFHCLQYLIFVTYWRHRRQQAAAHEQSTSIMQYIFSKAFLGYYVKLVLLGLGMFIFVPILLDAVKICAFATAATLTVSFINLHHFVLDGSIWRLRKPEIRQNAGL